MKKLLCNAITFFLFFMSLQGMQKDKSNEETADPRKFGKKKPSKELVLEAACQGDVEQVTQLVRRQRRRSFRFPRGDKLFLDAENAGDIQALYNAAEQGKIEILKTLLDNVSSKNRTELVEKLFFWSIKNGYLAVIDLLIKSYSADPNVQDEDKYALHLAVEHSHVDVGMLLLDNQANPNVCDQDKKTPLHYAVKRGDQNFVECLLEYKANPNMLDNNNHLPLYFVDENLDLIKILIDHGSLIADSNHDRKGLVSLAAERGHCEALECLLEHKVNPNSGDRCGTSPLFLAVSNRHLGAVTLLLAFKAKPTSCGSRGSSPLHEAAKKGYTEIVDELCKNGKKIDPNVCDREEKTPLHYAAQGGQAAIVECLLKHGADPNMRDGQCETPLQLAVRKRSAAVVKVLLENKADSYTREQAKRTAFTFAKAEKYTVLHRAAEQGDLEIVKLLIRHGADTNARTSLNKTPLHVASEHGHKEVATYLMEHKADVNAHDGNQVQTPLRGAVKKGHLNLVAPLVNRGAKTDAIYVNTLRRVTILHEVAKVGNTKGVKSLLKKEGDPHICDCEGKVPLHLAAENGHSHLVEIFFKHGMDTDICDGNGQTPLHRAVEKRDIRMVEALFNCWANPNISDNNGQMPMQLAVANGDAHIVSCLLDNDAEFLARDNLKRTLLHRAVSEGYQEVTECLVDAGVAINASDDFKQTSLHIAADRGHEDLVKYLLGKEADPNLVDEDKKTPLHLAAQKGRYKSIKALMEKGADILARDGEGNTPWYYVTKEKRIEIDAMIKPLIIKQESKGKRELACIICFNEKSDKDMTFVCYRCLKLVCNDCSKKLKNCPTCRKSYSE